MHEYKNQNENLYYITLRMAGVSENHVIDIDSDSFDAKDFRKSLKMRRMVLRKKNQINTLICIREKYPLAYKIQMHSIKTINTVQLDDFPAYFNDIEMLSCMHESKWNKLELEECKKKIQQIKNRFPLIFKDYLTKHGLKEPLSYDESMKFINTPCPKFCEAEEDELLFCIIMKKYPKACKRYIQDNFRIFIDSMENDIKNFASERLGFDKIKEVVTIEDYKWKEMEQDCVLEERFNSFSDKYPRAVVEYLERFDVFMDFPIKISDRSESWNKLSYEQKKEVAYRSESLWLKEQIAIEEDPVKGKIVESIKVPKRSWNVDTENIHGNSRNSSIIKKKKIPVYLFFDTETSGLPQNYNAPTSDMDNWPRLIQLSWIIADQAGDIIKKANYIIRPNGFVIPESVSKVHGITTQRASVEGVDLTEAIDEFMEDVDKCEFIIGHNVSFDKKIVGAELVRMGRHDTLSNKKSCCTMESTKNFCKISGSYGYKYPKLQELYYKLFGRNFNNAHNSAADVNATYECYWELRKRGVL